MKVYTEGLTDIEAKVVEKMVIDFNHHPDTIHYSHSIKKLRSGFYPTKIKKGRSLRRYVKIKPHWVII